MWLPHLCQQWGMWDYSRCALSCSPTRSNRSKPPALNLPKHCLEQQLLFWSQNVDEDWGALRYPAAFPQDATAPHPLPHRRRCEWWTSSVSCGPRLPIDSIFRSERTRILIFAGFHSMQMTTVVDSAHLWSAGWTALALTHLPFGAEGLNWVCSW